MIMAFLHLKSLQFRGAEDYTASRLQETRSDQTKGLRTED